MYKTKWVLMLFLGVMAALVISSQISALEIKVYDPPLTRTDESQINGSTVTPDSPLSAFDTWRVCLSQRKPAICAKIGLHEMVFRATPSGKEKKLENYSEKTIVLKKIVVMPEDLGRPTIPTWARSGDVRIEWKFESCLDSGKKLESCQGRVARLRTHNQKMTVAAMQIALMKVWAQRS
ncbi:hypothetical protein [Magnetospira sp. QH-2]|uniref:hypothetical protein n=1 Tax=Magnetospira sp. (strain QH-2) TaxID=1288970 RepID=UPI0011DD73EB|nr:hypothetical protein [Magnetospira sp. QH-2]